MLSLLGDVVVANGGWGIGHVLIAIIVIAAVVGITYAALKEFGVAIPAVVIKIFWIVVVAALAILAIKFLLSL